MNPLTPAECAIVSAIVAGHTRNKELSGALKISQGTVRSHCARIFDKTGVQDKTQLVLWALRNGWTLDGITQTTISQIPNMLRHLAREMETLR